MPGKQKRAQCDNCPATKPAAPAVAVPPKKKPTVSQFIGSTLSQQ